MSPATARPPSAFVPVLEDRLSLEPGVACLPVLVEALQADAPEAGLPILTDVLSIRLGGLSRRSTARGSEDVNDPPAVMGEPVAVPEAAAAPDAIDFEVLEQRLQAEITQALGSEIQRRVHASVVPAVEVLADRIAHKAAQEAGEAVLESLEDDIRGAIHRAVQACAAPGSTP